MSAFPDWQKYAVAQKRLQTGCIPTGYEILLRVANAQGIEWNSFQDEFDLDKNGGQPRNHFISVSDEVKKKYPHIEFRCEVFAKDKGHEKLKRVEDFIRQQQPVLVSLAQAPQGGWHIMLLVDAEDDSLTLLHHVDPTHGPVTQRISKVEFIYRHDHWAGGEEIAYLEKCPICRNENL